MCRDGRGGVCVEVFKGEDVFVEYYVSGSEQFVSSQVVHIVSLLSVWVSHEDTFDASRGEFSLWRFGVGYVTKAPKNFEVFKIRSLSG